MIHKLARIGHGCMIWFENLSNIGNCTIGTGCVIHSHVWIGDGVKIGNRVKIQAFSFIPDGVTIGDDVFIGPRVTFTNDKHPPSYGRGWSGTIVNDGASIGACATILPGIIIGKNAVIGAGSVVTKSVDDGKTVYGVPAR
jgi:UDP-2-acetamido-3-amino-2,3-dideoxy-glucuronate N-acetyltransferase